MCSHGMPLRQTNPGFSEEELYQTARLIVAALNARIHTIEWTPALFGNELMNITMHNNWCAPCRARTETCKAAAHRLSNVFADEAVPRWQEATAGTTMQLAVCAKPCK